MIERSPNSQQKVFVSHQTNMNLFKVTACLSAIVPIAPEENPHPPAPDEIEKQQATSPELQFRRPRQEDSGKTARPTLYPVVLQQIILPLHPAKLLPQTTRLDHRMEVRRTAQ